jgi:hypothetical protein
MLRFMLVELLVGERRIKKINYDNLLLYLFVSIKIVRIFVLNKSLLYIIKIKSS